MRILNHLRANPTKKSDTLKQFVGCCRRIVLSVSYPVVGLALKGLTISIQSHWHKAKSDINLFKPKPMEKRSS